MTHNPIAPRDDEPEALCLAPVALLEILSEQLALACPADPDVEELTEELREWMLVEVEIESDNGLRPVYPRRLA